MDQQRLEALLEEATFECYNEEEELLGILYTLVDNLNFPLQATWSDAPVEVIGLDETPSIHHQGILARVRKHGQNCQAPLQELEFIDPDPISAEWLAVYRYWLR